MNKLVKIGASALCGSLAAVASANAGAMTVAGGATATWTQLSYGETGNPLGMATNLTFAGSGELDNGGTFTLTIAHDDQNGYSTSSLAYTSATLGTITYDEGGGTGLDRIDDKMPTAWEETDGTGVGSGLVTVSGAGGTSDIEWAVSQDTLPEGMSAYIAVSPKADGQAAVDKAVGGDAASNVNGAGYDIVLEAADAAGVAGLNMFAGWSTIAQGGQDDHTGHAIGATYAVGSFTLGYQFSRDNHNDPDGTSYYENNAFGVSFLVNDNLSISYGEHKSERNSDRPILANTLTAQSIQLAYTMGGATLKVAETTFDGANYLSTAAGDKDGTTIALSLAF